MHESLATTRERPIPRVSGRVYEFSIGDELGVACDMIAGVPNAPMGGIVGQLASATICATDISNQQGLLGHGKLHGRVAGHESCYKVIESNVDGISKGQYVVTLGDDFFGLAQYFAFKPIHPGNSVPVDELIFDQRGSFLDPPAGYKAVLVIDDWFSGASILETATHVYTSFHYNQLKEFDSVLILGGGLCGLIAAQLFRHYEVDRILIMETDSDRLDHASSLGLVDTPLNPLTGLDEIARLISSTRGAGVGHVFDALPAFLQRCEVDTRELAAKLVKPAGRWTLFGATNQALFPLLPLLAKGVQIGGAPFDSRLIAFEQRARYMKKTLRLVEAGVIEMSHLVGGEVSFDDKDAVRGLFDPGRSGLPLRTEIRATSR